MAEYLKLRKVHPWGAEAFDKISVNISKDERNLKLDAGEICMFASLCVLFLSYLYRLSYRVHVRTDWERDPLLFHKWEEH